MIEIVIVLEIIFGDFQMPFCDPKKLMEQLNGVKDSQFDPDTQLLFAHFGGTELKAYNRCGDVIAVIKAKKGQTHQQLLDSIEDYKHGS